MSLTLNLIGQLLGAGFFAWLFLGALMFWRLVLPSDGVIVRGTAAAALAFGLAGGLAVLLFPQAAGVFEAFAVRSEAVPWVRILLLPAGLAAGWMLARSGLFIEDVLDRWLGGNARNG